MKRYKIYQVDLGLQTIPPKNWGAVEKIIYYYNYYLSQDERFDSYIITLSDYLDLKSKGQLKEDIYLHFHIYNLVNDFIKVADLKEKSFVFTCHDHHCLISNLALEVNLDVMNKSKLNIFPSELLLIKFLNYQLLNQQKQGELILENFIFLPHGVDTKKFYFNTQTNLKELKPTLICIGNNGLIKQPEVDRKGFLIAIEVAKKLDLELKIFGPTDINKRFFEIHKDKIDYPKLQIYYDYSEDELISELQKNKNIFLHFSSLEAGHPNLTILETLALGIPGVGTYLGRQILNGYEVVPIDELNNIDNHCEKVNKIIENYDDYRDIARLTALKYDWSNIVNQLKEIYISKVFNDYPILTNSTSFFSKLQSIYLNSNKELSDMNKQNLIQEQSQDIKYKPIETDSNYIIIDEFENKYHFKFLDGAFVEIVGKKLNVDYKVEFINSNTNTVVYETNLKTNHWARTNFKYYIPWKIRINDFEYVLSLKNKKVLITIGSGALGDTLAWLPYAIEFQKLHDCYLTLQTNYNSIIDGSKLSDKIKLVDMSKSLNTNNYYAWYQLFCDDNDNLNFFRHQVSWRLLPLQKIASDILGIPYKELKPPIKKDFNSDLQVQGKYVIICPESTMQNKFWNNPSGWPVIIDYLKKSGFTVVCITKNYIKEFDITDDEKYLYFSGKSLNQIIPLIVNSEFIISLGNGLSWLAWSLDKKVILISGFSLPYTEFQTDCYRVFNFQAPCIGCYNDPSLPFNRGDWNWCPRNQNFICTRMIYPEMVIEKIKEIQ